MVGMGVRIENGIQPGNPLPDGLCAKVGGCVDQYAAPPVFQHDRGPCAPVMRIAGSADEALAADGRNTHGCAAAQHSQDCIHRLLMPGPPIRGPCPGGGALAMAFVISIQAMRSSNSTF